MAAIRALDNCVQLVQQPPDSLKEKVEVLTRQKEQLRHRLLTQSSETYSTGESAAYLGNVWLAAQQPYTTNFIEPNAHGAAKAHAGAPLGHVQPPYHSYIATSNVASNGKMVHGETRAASAPCSGITAGAHTSQMNIAIPSYGSVPSAPASFSWGTKIDDDGGIWA